MASRISVSRRDPALSRRLILSGGAIACVMLMPFLSRIGSGGSLFGFPFPYFMAILGLPALLILLVAFAPRSDS